MTQQPSDRRERTWRAKDDTLTRTTNTGSRKQAREQLRSSYDHVTTAGGQTMVGYTRERLLGAQMPGRACVDGAAAGVGSAGVQINLVQRRERSGSLNPPRLMLSSPTFRTLLALCDRLALRRSRRPGLQRNVAATCRLHFIKPSRNTLVYSTLTRTRVLSTPKHARHALNHHNLKQRQMCPTYSFSNLPPRKPSRKL